ncbi:hypothetical protein Holit_02125 [Hollandina sp. SP2]
MAEELHPSIGCIGGQRKEGKYLEFAGKKAAALVPEFEENRAAADAEGLEVRSVNNRNGMHSTALVSFYVLYLV